MISSKIENFKISQKMLDQIENLRNSEKTLSKKFTDEQDAIIVQYYKIKNKDDLAKLIGCAPSTMRKRYLELTDAKKN